MEERKRPSAVPAHRIRSQDVSIERALQSRTREEFLEITTSNLEDPLGQVGEFVDGKQAPVGPGDQPVVESQLVGKVPAFGNPDWVYLADQVSN